MFKSHIKFDVLEELKENNLTGYDLIKRLKNSNGKKPSTGYIYPLLNNLKKNGHISCINKEKKKIYSITKKGIKLLIKLKTEYSINKISKLIISKNKELIEFNNIILKEYNSNKHREELRKFILKNTIELKKIIGEKS